jgi:hypothetical protein
MIMLLKKTLQYANPGLKERPCPRKRRGMGAL